MRGEPTTPAGEIVLRVEYGNARPGVAIVERAPDHTLIAGEVIEQARNGHTNIRYRREVDGRTVLAFGTPGRGLGQVEYALTGWYDVARDAWRAQRIEPAS